MAKCPGLLLLLRIERPTLGAAHAASIHQGRCPGYPVAGQPLVGGAKADPCLAGQISQPDALVNVSTYKQPPAEAVSRAFGWVCMVCELWGRR